MQLTYFLFQVTVALLAIVTYILHRKLTYFKRRGIPYDKPHPLRGNMEGYKKTRTVHEIHQEYYNKYRNSKAPFVGFYLFQKPAAFVIDLELAKQILIKNFSNFTDKGIYYNEKDDPMSAHLFNLDGPQWRLLRSKLSSTFTSGKMKFMYPTVVSVAEEFMAVMHEKVSENSILDVRDLVARFTVDVIGTCAFGIKCNSLRDEKAEFLHFGRRALLDSRHGNLVSGLMRSYPNLARRLGLCRNTAQIQEFYQRIVKETVTLREKENIKRNDFMDMLIGLKNQRNMTLENGEVVKGLTMDEIVAQAFVFFIAGFDTSSSTMGFALYELAKNPSIQDKVRAELGQVLEQHDQKFTYECIKDLKYLDQVINGERCVFKIPAIPKDHKMSFQKLYAIIPLYRMWIEWPPNVLWFRAIPNLSSRLDSRSLFHHRPYITIPVFIPNPMSFDRRGFLQKNPPNVPRLPGFPSEKVLATALD